MIGVITCGGDCPGLNSVLYALQQAFDGQLIGIVQNKIHTSRPAFETIKLDNLPKYITQIGGTILGSIVENDLKKHDKQRFLTLSQDLQTIIKQAYLSALIVIAGDGGIEIMSGICESIACPMIAIPKTIDNDVAGSDFSIGFHSAIAHVTEQLDALSDTVRSHKRVMLAEVMGRDAGYIALLAGIAASTDAILIPEIPYTQDRLAAFVKERYTVSDSGVVIVVAEGVDPVPSVTTLEQQLNLPHRSVCLGHIQRGGKPDAFDRLLAAQMAAKAKQLVDQNCFGHMLVFCNNQIDNVPIKTPLRRTVENLTYWKAVTDQLGIFTE